MSIATFIDRMLIRAYRRLAIPKWTKVGEGVFIGRGVRLDRILHGALITIGDGAYITSGVTILCHDASCVQRLGFFRAAPVIIGRNAFIGVNAVVMPGVRIGDNAIVGAGSVVTCDIPDGVVAAGVPAREIMKVEDLVEKRADLGDAVIVPFSRCRRLLLDRETRELIRKAYDDNGFIIKGW